MKHSAALFFALVLFSPVFPFAEATTLEVPYTGLDKLHVTYEIVVDNCGIPSDASQYIQVRLEIEKAGGSTQIVTQSSVPRDSRINFSGEKLVEDLTAGVHTFKIITRLENGDEQTVIQRSATVHENFIDGTLLFDETIESDSGDPIGCGYVVVPEGITLNLGGLSYSGGTIRVTGSIALDEAVLDLGTPVRVTFTKTVHLSAPPDAYYILQGAGSTIVGASKVNVAAADATLSGIHNLNLSMELATGTVHVLNSTVTLNFWDLLAASEVLFERCVLPNENIYIRTGDDLQFRHCVFSSGPAVNLYKDSGEASFRDCFFRGSTRITGIGACECSFQDCEFASTVWFEERTAPILRNNIVLGYLYFDGQSWLANSEPAPIIESNSFMGRSAIMISLYGQKPNAQIVIGSNYYGDENGPTLVYWDHNPDRLFLNDRGAQVIMGFQGQELGPLVQLAPHTTKAPGPRRDKEVPPSVWAAGVVFGQNTISHKDRFTPLVAGRESLLCADIVCSEPDLTGVEIYLEIDGQRIDSTRPLSVLHRDLADYGGKSDIVRAQSTVNFIVPPQEDAIESIRIMADIGGAKGSSRKSSPFSLWEISSFPVLPAPARDLNIIVQPVRLYLYGFTGTPAPPLPASSRIFPILCRQCFQYRKTKFDSFQLHRSHTQGSSPTLHGSVPTHSSMVSQASWVRHAPL